MFGMIKACSHHLEPELLEQWRAHLCGLCVNLRDSRGQLSRAATNTDAVMLSVLVEAQLSTPSTRKTAGPCPLRAMQTASIISPATDGPRLGATASLVLAAAKAADMVQEHRHHLGTSSSLAAKAAGSLATRLTDKALVDSKLARAIGADDLLAELGRQGEIERQVQPGDELDEVTAPTSAAAAAIFASAADLAGAPANREQLTLMGASFGRLAHLIDAVQDLEKDRLNGSFNPITATGRTLEFVHNRCRHLAGQIRRGFDQLELADGRLLKALLVDGVRRAVREAFHDGSTNCSVDHRRDSTATNVQYSGVRNHQGQPGPPPGYGPPPGQWPGDGRPPTPPNQKFWPNVLPWVGIYCTGWACCADHVNPCTGINHEAGCKNCDCCSDCDCCDSCDCCDC